MDIREHIKFSAVEDRFPERMRSVLREQLHWASEVLHERRVSHTIRLVVAAPPPLRPGRSIVFYAFATNRTAFGAIEALERPLAEWYLETGILPIVNPIPMKYFDEPQLLPKQWFRPIVTRGVGIYTHAD